MLDFGTGADFNLTANVLVFGSDFNGTSGTLIGTFSSISAGLAAAATGDTVYVRSSGSPYNENVTLKNGVSLIGQSESGVVINGTMITPASFDHAVVSNMTVNNVGDTMLLDMRGTSEITDATFSHVTFNQTSDFTGETLIGNGQLANSIALHDGNSDGNGLTFQNVTMASHNFDSSTATAFAYTTFHSGDVDPTQMLLDHVTLSGTASGTAGSGLGAQWNMTPVSSSEHAYLTLSNSSTSAGGNYYVSGFDGVDVTGNTFDAQGIALNGVKHGTVTGNTFENITDAIWANEVAFNALTNQHRGLVIEDAWGTSGVSGVTVHDNTFDTITAADGAIAFQRFNSGLSGVASIDRLNDIQVYTNTFTGVADPIYLNPTYFGTDAVLPDSITTQQLLIGTTGVDTLSATDVGTTIVGGPGADTITGGAGDDTVIWHPGDGADAINGGLQTTADTLAIYDTSDADSIQVVTDGTTITGIGGSTNNVTGIETVTLDA